MKMVIAAFAASMAPFCAAPSSARLSATAPGFSASAEFSSGEATTEGTGGDGKVFETSFYDSEGNRISWTRSDSLPIASSIPEGAASQETKELENTDSENLVAGYYAQRWPTLRKVFAADVKWEGFQDRYGLYSVCASTNEKAEIQASLLRQNWTNRPAPQGVEPHYLMQSDVVQGKVRVRIASDEPFDLVNLTVNSQIQTPRLDHVPGWFTATFLVDDINPSTNSFHLNVKPQGEELASLSGQFDA